MYIFLNPGLLMDFSKLISLLILYNIDSMDAAKL